MKANHAPAHWIVRLYRILLGVFACGLGFVVISYILSLALAHPIFSDPLLPISFFVVGILYYLMAARRSMQTRWYWAAAVCGAAVLLLEEVALGVFFQPIIALAAVSMVLSFFPQVLVYFGVRQQEVEVPQRQRHRNRHIYLYMTLRNVGLVVIGMLMFFGSPYLNTLGILSYGSSLWLRLLGVVFILYGVLAQYGKL